MTLLSTLATGIGILTALAYFPQAYRIFKRKSSQDISLIFFSIVTTSVFIWLLYGIELQNFPIIIVNSIAICGAALVLGLSIYYKKKKHALFP